MYGLAGDTIGRGRRLVFELAAARRPGPLTRVERVIEIVRVGLHSFATPRSRYDRAKRKKAHAVTGSNSANRYLSIGGDTIVQ